ncbi:hypothetical protein ANO11243_010350 [Dothideomycetidae sp. 11243]|nr:hypothetical protein ANO11243_010350 [fungal sp. No.11243]
MAKRSYHSLDLDARVRRDAAQNIRDERATGVLESFRLYRKAVLWSLALSSCIIMEGFGTLIIGASFALPSFQHRFGSRDELGGISIASHWQSAINTLAIAGNIVGLLLSGFMVERIGYKHTLMIGLAVLGATISITFTAHTATMLAVGNFLCGIPWGVFQTTTTTYASEVCPLQLRPFLTTWVNFCWCLGQMLSSLVLRSVIDLPGDLSFRIPLATQWVWILPLLIAIAFAPESPWWLIRRGRTDDAREALLRLTTHRVGGVDTRAAVNMMVYTNELEKAQSGGSDYRDCFKGADLRRTEISCFVWAIQNLSGGSLMGYSAYFFLQAGMSSDVSFTFQIAQYGLGMIGTTMSWLLMIYFGRRTLYLFGHFAGLAIFATMGLVAVFVPGSVASWVIGALLLTFVFCYDATLGPVCYTLVAEISSTRLRNKTIVLARIFYNVCGIIMGLLTPPMLNPQAWDLGGKAGFVFFGLTLMMLVWTYFRLPETKGRSFFELDVLFGDGTPARAFASSIVSLGSACDAERAMSNIRTFDPVCPQSRSMSLVENLEFKSGKNDRVVVVTVAERSGTSPALSEIKE